MITRLRSRPAPPPAGWALALLVGVLTALLPLAVAAAPPGGTASAAVDGRTAGATLRSPLATTARPLLGDLAPRAAPADLARPGTTPRADPPALLGAAPTIYDIARQQTDDQATLETRRPEVQWGAGDSGDWQSITAQQTVRAGDRVRTGNGASARLVYFEGTTVDI